MKKNVFLLGVIVLLILPVIFNLLRPGFFVTDDGDWMVIRFSAFYQEVRAGQIPVRFLTRLNNGYGYPVATFLYPGFMYLATIPKALGFGFVWSIKLVMVASVIVGTLFIYKWIRLKMSPLAGAFGAVLFAYHPYLLFDIYHRGSVGEILALAVLPIGLWAIAAGKTSSIPFTYAALILAHNTIALIGVPILLLYHLIKKFWGLQGGIHAALQVGGALLLGVGMASFFFIPAVTELPLTVFASTTVSNWREYFIGGGMSTGELGSFGLLGYVHGFVFICALLFFARGAVYRTRELLFLLILFITGVLLSTPLSSVVWELLPLGKFVQFPMRALVLCVIALPYIGAVVFDEVIPKAQLKLYTFIASAVLLTILGSRYFTPSAFTYRDESYYSTNQATTTVLNEYMPKWVGSPVPAGRMGATTRISPDTVQVNTVYWPGYTVYVNDQSVPVSYENQYGLMHVPSFSDTDRIKVIFKESSERFLADGVSIVCGMIVLYIAWRSKQYG